MHKVERKAPKYAEICETGLEWNYLVWQAEDAWEEYGIIEMLQETANAGQAVALAETRLETCLKAVQNAQKLCGIDPKTLKRDPAKQKLDEKEVWAKVQSIALRSRPTFEKEIPDLIKFVQNFSGGLENPKFIHSVISYQRTLQCPRIIPGHILAAVSGCLLGADGRSCNEFRLDCIRAMLGATDKYAENGAQKMFITSDFHNKFGGKKKATLVVQANQMKEIGIALVAEHAPAGFVNPALQSALDLFGIRLVHYVGEKPDTTRGVFTSMHDIGYAFVQDLSNLLNKQIESPWAPSAKAKQEEEKAKKTGSTGAASFGQDGHVNRVEHLAGLGMKAKVTVNLKETQRVEWAIVEVTDDAVKLISNDTKDEKVIDTASFMKAVLAKAVTFPKSVSGKEDQMSVDSVTAHHMQSPLGRGVRGGGIGAMVTPGAPAGGGACVDNVP